MEERKNSEQCNFIGEFRSDSKSIDLFLSLSAVSLLSVRGKLAHRALRAEEESQT